MIYQQLWLIETSPSVLSLFSSLVILKVQTLREIQTCPEIFVGHADLITRKLLTLSPFVFSTISWPLKGQGFWNVEM